MSGRTRRQKASQQSQAEEDKAVPRENGTIQKTSPKKKQAAASDMPKENIFLFWPNIIGTVLRSYVYHIFITDSNGLLTKLFSGLLGYMRIFLAIASLYYMPLHPRTCSILYSVSCLLDALDGYVARAYNQSTTFGAVLDMVTDRCTTACLLVFLSSAWPRWAIMFQGLISLDLASHYMHMYATLSMGGANQSHKKIDSSRSWILYQYYNNRVSNIPFILSGLSRHV